jgi:hypothetical protein
MNHSLKSLKRNWRGSSLGSESTLHQLSPYIGKLKTSIARSLITNFSRPGDIGLDPFCGSGVVPLEALLAGRGAVANDASPYASVLTRGKLFPIEDPYAAIARASEYVELAKEVAATKHYRVPSPAWVKQFFHPRTLAEVKVLSDMLLRDSQWFLLANLLGIIHHQRPGFLSYPSSHLVPYLRSRKYPRKKFPELYRYRDVGPRFVRKLERTYRRHQPLPISLPRLFSQADIREFSCPIAIDFVVTSPPYMNALDYGRDNRLRLWFLDHLDSRILDRANPRTPAEFADLMKATAYKLKSSIRKLGVAIVIVGEVRRKSSVLRSNEIARSAFEREIGGWRLTEMLSDPVPDIRRSRRGYAATKTEWIMIFKRS